MDIDAHYEDRCEGSLHASPDEYGEEEHDYLHADDDPYDDDDQEEQPPCPVCDGYGEPLGTLGRRTHYRCRYCGIDFSTTTDEEGTCSTANRIA